MVWEAGDAIWLSLTAIIWAQIEWLYRKCCHWENNIFWIPLRSEYCFWIFEFSYAFFPTPSFKWLDEQVIELVFRAHLLFNLLPRNSIFHNFYLIPQKCDNNNNEQQTTIFISSFHNCCCIYLSPSFCISIWFPSPSASEQRHRKGPTLYANGLCYLYICWLTTTKLWIHSCRKYTIKKIFFFFCIQFQWLLPNTNQCIKIRSRFSVSVSVHVRVTR